MGNVCVRVFSCMAGWGEWWAEVLKFCVLERWRRQGRGGGTHSFWMSTALTVCSSSHIWHWRDQFHHFFFFFILPAVILTPARLLGLIWLQAMCGLACLAGSPMGGGRTCACVYACMWVRGGGGVRWGGTLWVHLVFHRANTCSPIYQINETKSWR